MKGVDQVSERERVDPPPFPIAERTREVAQGLLELASLCLFREPPQLLPLGLREGFHGRAIKSRKALWLKADDCFRDATFCLIFVFSSPMDWACPRSRIAA